MNEHLEYAHAQSRMIGEIIEEHEDVQEAISNSFSWALIAYDGIVEQGAPALYTATAIVAAINSALMNRVMQPPEPA